MVDVDFFFDPICPWAWITSRWVEEVASQRALEVDWRFIALRFVNEERYAQMAPRYAESHQLGLRLLRVAAGAKTEGGAEAAGRVYTAVGGAIHVEGRRDDLSDPAALEKLLEASGLPASLAKAADDESLDATIRSDTDEALARTGKDVGTPIITFTPPDGPSFFGPVISRIPRGEEAVGLWDSVERLARFPGFFELKRSVRERPQTS
ncbi:MAG TPA: DsbA family protein [Acidimicrobiales bacterium]|nr:DsbA family protein [Acidimicrobiales bacterium]